MYYVKKLTIFYDLGIVSDMEKGNLLDDVRSQINLFISGISAGAAVFTFEMLFFFGDTVINALFNSIPASDAGNSAISYYNFIIFILIIAGLIQGFSIGLFDKGSFTIGYIFGILFILIFFGSVLFDIAPKIVFGMVIAFISIAIGLYLKVLMIKKRENNYGYY